MKTILCIILFSVELCYAQFIPHKASLTASKDSVLSSEQFTVTYSLTEVEGYVYIGTEDLYFDVIGKDRCEGRMKLDDIKNVTFQLKFKEKFKPYISSERVPVCIGFSYKPFGKRIGEHGEFECISINLSDFNDFKSEKKEIDSTNFNKLQNLNLYPLDTNLEINKKTVIPNPNQIKLEYPKSRRPDVLVSEGNKSVKSIENIKSDIGNILTGNRLLETTDIIVRFDAALVSFRNLSNQMKPWQYYFMAVTN